jgi:UDP-hydrolysing UDP-N-acetyl-D-glucosamine 2-epimerase
MRTIGVVTAARSDYSIILPLLKRIHQDPELRLCLIVSGMHLSPEFGLTVHDIEADGFPIAAKVEMLLSSDTPGGIAKSMGLGTINLAQVFESLRPDILVVLGDRFEMHAAVVAAVPFLIPVAHIAGGALTLGAIDDSLRHSMTKLSHLHFCETETYARRVIQMGEEPWRVKVTGAMALDNLREIRYLSLEELDARYGLGFSSPPLLVTFHPVTREYEQTEHYMRELLAALEEFDLPIVFTYPNADTNGRVIIRLIEEFAAQHSRVRALPSLGLSGYFSMMNCALAMVGNSSSGMIESASFKLPVVNIGTRQKGRIAARNVITVGCSRAEIAAGIRQAASHEFRRRLADLINPYGDGHTSEAVHRVLKTVAIDGALLNKGFHDCWGGTGSLGALQT